MKGVYATAEDVRKSEIRCTVREEDVDAYINGFVCSFCGAAAGTPCPPATKIDAAGNEYQPTTARPPHVQRLKRAGLAAIRALLERKT